MPDFSVIIPTYNRVNYLREAVESVLAQTYKSFEVIVVDDGSTDETEEVMQTYSNRVKYIHQSNKGRCMARNKGIEEARGKWIAFLDSDDKFFSNKLARQAQYLTKHPEISMLHGAVDLIGANEEALPEATQLAKRLWENTHLNHNTYEDYAYIFRCYPSTAVIRSECLKEIGGFDPDLSTSEDHDFFLRVASRYKIGAMAGESCVYYRMHGGNTKSDVLYRGFIKMATKHLELLQTGQMPVNTRLAARNFHLSLSKSYFMMNDVQNGRKEFSKALAINSNSFLVFYELRIFLASFLPTPLKGAFKTFAHFLTSMLRKRP